MPNPPKPTQLKVLQGTDKKNPGRLNPNEPKPAPAVGAKAPTWLPKKGIPWSQYLKHRAVLERVKVLTDGDVEALALGCMALDDYLEGRRLGMDWRKVDSAWKRYMAMLIQFGLTPSSRTKVSTLATPTVDPLAAWTAGRAAGGGKP